MYLIIGILCGTLMLLNLKDYDPKVLNIALFFVILGWPLYLLYLVLSKYIPEEVE